MVSGHCLFLLLVLLSAPLAAAQDIFLSPRVADGAWDKVRHAMEKFPLIHKAMLTVGDASGELFNYAIGGVTRDTKMEMYSSTKWVFSITFYGSLSRENNLACVS